MDKMMKMIGWNKRCLSAIAAFILAGSSLSAQEQYQHYTQAMEYNKFTLNAYNEQFLIGQRTLLDVLDSENELFNSSTQAETAKSNVLIGAWRMLALSGEMLPKMNIDYSGLDKAPPVDPEDRREVFEPGWFN